MSVWALMFFVCGGGYDRFHCEWKTPVHFSSKSNCEAAMYGRNMNGYRIGQGFLMARCVEVNKK